MIFSTPYYLKFKFKNEFRHDRFIVSKKYVINYLDFKYGAILLFIPFKNYSYAVNLYKYLDYKFLIKNDPGIPNILIINPDMKIA